MRYLSVIFLLLFNITNKGQACSCNRAWNDCFNLSAKTSDFTGIVKVLSFDDSLLKTSMLVEVKEVLKGKLTEQVIRIFGDDGMSCRQNLQDFKINNYYVICPRSRDENLNSEYYLHACRTEHLFIDTNSLNAIGQYTLLRSQIGIEHLRRKYTKRTSKTLNRIEFGITSLLFLIIGIEKKFNEGGSRHH